MKYNSLRPFFEEFLRTDNFLFLTICPNNYERCKILDRICYLLSKEKNFSIKSLKDTKGSVEALIASIEDISFFAEESLVIIDEIDLLNKREIQLISTYLKNKNSIDMVVLGASKNKNILDIFRLFEKKGLIIDLQYEKSYEKQRRFSEYIQEICKKYKKKITSNAIDLLFEKVGFDLAAIENETVKVTIYVKDKEIIDEKDISEVCSTNENANMWQIAENIVWGENFQNTSNDISSFHPLIAAIRYQLNVGLKLALFKDEDYLLPRMPYKLLQQRKIKAKKLGFIFFKNAMNFLYEIDLLSKSSVNEPQALLELFYAKLKQQEVNV